MTEKDNVARVVKIYEAFGKGDVEYIVGQLTDGVRWVTHLEPEVPWAGNFSEKRNVPKFFAAIRDSVEVTAFTPREFIAQGDTVVSTGELGCTSRTTGKSALTKWVFIWKFEEGKVRDYEQFHDPAIVNAFRA